MPVVGITLMIALLGAACGNTVRTAVLDLPSRPADAPGGDAFADYIRDLDLEAREERIYAEIARGNVPSSLRTLVPVEMIGEIDGRKHRVTIWVTPDYLSVGSDDDFFLTPLSPQTAQRIADLVDAALPTSRMVDAIWASAKVRLDPAPIPPSPEMTTVPVFEQHNRTIRAQRHRHKAGAAALVAGHKKDVVVTAALATQPDKVAIYGWHRADGQPIQPLYTGHSDRWVDYSHGIRLVDRAILVDGTPRDIFDTLRNEQLAPLLSDDGVIERPRYESLAR